MLDERVTSHSPHVTSLWMCRPMRRYEPICAIDMGSRTFKLVGGYHDGRQIVTRLLKKATLDLGAEIALTGGPIRAAKLAEIEAVLSLFRSHSKRKGISKLVAVGTAAIKRATNNREILMLGRKLGIEMEIADGRREGELGYLAATGGKPENLVCELGSRSSQITWMTGESIISRRVNTGYVHAYETCFVNATTPGDACGAYREFLNRQIDHLPSSMDRLTALTATTCSSYVSGLKKKQVTGTSLSSAAVHDTLQMLQALTPGEFYALKTRTRKAEKILPGLVFLDFVMERSGHEKAHITDIELPVGLIVEHFNIRSHYKTAAPPP